jgi:anti-sigma regulatory factor (Ser/Thr protein kinase)
MTKFEAKVRARPEEISDLTERAGDFLDRAGVDTRAAHHVAMILDELLTNLATHGGVIDEPAAICICVETSRVRVEFTDSGPPFDPLTAAEPDLTGSAAERKIGGLGLFLMRKIANDLYYRRDGGHNYTGFAILRS